METPREDSNNQIHENSHRLNPKHHRRWVVAVIASVLMIFAVPVVLNFYRVSTMCTRAEQIKIGDSKDQVSSIMGSPNQIYPPSSGFLFGYASERWAYGNIFIWNCIVSSEFPFIHPFNFRVLGPDPKDVVIDFDSQNHVTKVKIPPTH